MKPLLSVIVPAYHGWESVLPAIGCWTRQTRADRLEILVVAPGAVADADAAEVPRGCVAVASPSRRLHEMRAAALWHARGDYVMLAEDHCVPDADFVEALLPAMEGGEDLIGVALRPGRRDTWACDASFLLGYGEWMRPRRGPAQALPGHNFLGRRELLESLGQEVLKNALVSAFLVRELGRRGARSVMEPAARMRHFDVKGLGPSLTIFFVVGLGFGALRTEPWGLVGRLVYPLAAPAVAALHWWRGLREFRRAGNAVGLRGVCLVPAVLLSIAWACGEAIGGLAGPDRVADLTWRGEVKPVTAEDVAG